MPANVVQRILRQADAEYAQADQRDPALSRGFSAGSHHDDRVRLPAPEHDGRRRPFSASAARASTRRRSTPATSPQDHKLIGLVDGQGPASVRRRRRNDRVHHGGRNVIYRRHAATTRSRSPRCSSKYDFLALPVVDTENRLVGIVTFDDAMDVMRGRGHGGYGKDGRYARRPSKSVSCAPSPFEIWKNRIPVADAADGLGNA